MSGETIRFSIGLRLSVDFVHIVYIKDKQMLVFHFTFELLLTGGVFLVSSVALSGFRELK